MAETGQAWAGRETLALVARDLAGVTLDAEDVERLAPLAEVLLEGLRTLDGIDLGAVEPALTFAAAGGPPGLGHGEDVKS